MDQENELPAQQGLQVAAAALQAAKQADEARQHAQRTAKVAIVGSLAVIAASVIGASVVASKYPLERYVYTDNAKAICEAPLEKSPLVTTNTVTEFAKDCAIDIDTFAYDSVERDLDRVASRCLTPGFRKKFFEASWLDQRIKSVKNGLLRVNSQTTGPVLVTNSGNTVDGYLWKVQVPVKRTFRQGDSVQGSNERIYEMDVYRVTKDAYNPQGLAINAMVEKTAVR